ncbi:unnamed protein product [Darwinula stevensoni]|uniref:CLIP domain-containing serine protease n=1 Tax=Darwinula stevensoni TaxID=69355 RepID=A0A7R8XCJ9_9CRUS|nr:unnamed protein product [Darwinula stevensoni]CAG0888903.1 unnamed protein product [Darwinula stevensoni]
MQVPNLIFNFLRTMTVLFPPSHSRPRPAVPEHITEKTILERQSCKMRNGGPGICTPIMDCPTVMKNYRIKRPIICDWGGGNENPQTHLVCCPTLTVKESSSTLQEVEVPLVNLASCSTAYSQMAGAVVKIPDGIKDSMLCAGEKGKDSCQGDSGGALLYEDPKSSRFMVVGISSFGYGCGVDGFPGIYTKVAPFQTWINRIVFQR